MNEKKKSFMMYDSFYVPIQLLQPEQKAQLLDAIFMYQIHGKQIDMSEAVQMCFAFMKIQFDSDLEKYEQICKKNRDSIGKRWKSQKRDSNIYDEITPVYDGILSDTNVNEEDNDSEEINLSVYTKSKIIFDDSFIDNSMRPVFVRWLEYKKARKEVYANADSLKACYAKLMRESHQDVLEAETMIENAIGNNYRGFFPLKSTQPRPLDMQPHKQVTQRQIEAFLADIEQ